MSAFPPKALFSLHPKIKDIQFKDTQTGAIRRYIPWYEKSGVVEFVYSNLKLSEQELQNFKPLKLNLTDAANSCTPYPKEYAKSIKLSQKEFQKRFTLSYKALHKEYVDITYVNTILLFDDALGEIEDLYNEYEFSYNYHYGYNKALIDNIKAKNQYAYAVADMLDYLYVSDDEQEEYDVQTKKLKEQYETLVTLLKEDMPHAIESFMIKGNLAPAIDFPLALSYYDEVRFIKSDFFKGAYTFSLNLREGKHTYTSKSHFHGKRLHFSSVLHKDIKNNPTKLLACITFSVCYSDMYKTSLSPRLKEASEEFYYLLKTAKPLPQIDQDSLDDIAIELKHQKEYQKIFTQKDPLLEEYETLDTLLQNIAFDPKTLSKKKKATKKYGFISLKIGLNKEDFFYNKHLQSPKELAQSISKALASENLKTLLTQYTHITHFENDQEEHNYYNYLLNLSYMLVAPRAAFDGETRLLSLFNNEHKAIQELVVQLSQQLNTLGEEKAQKLHNEPIKEHYLKALYALIAHATLEKSKYGEKESLWQQFNDSLYADNQGRDSNATAFLNIFSQEIPKQSIRTDKLLDNNFDKELKVKTQSEELYAALKQLDGMSSYLDKVDDTVTQVQKEKRGLGQRGKEKLNVQELINSPSYKRLLISTQTLSFFITIGKIGEYIQGKEKLKVHNLIGLAGDVLSTANDLAKAAELKIKHLPQKLEHLITPKKVHNLANFKVIARFGVIGAIANAINDADTINKEANQDLYYATNSKNTLYLALLLAPAWWALGGIAIAELVWYFLKDKIENTNIELYLYDSLLFNTFEHNNNTLFNKIEAQYDYQAKILLETIHTTDESYIITKNQEKYITKSSNIQGFIFGENVRNFIADSYDVNPELFKIAMANELARLKSVLYGITLKIQGEDNALLDFSSRKQTKIIHPFHDRNIYHCYSFVALSKRLGEDCTHLIQLHNGTPLAKQKAFEKDSDGNVIYNTMFNDALDTMQALGHMDATEIIVATREISLKYKVIYEYTKTPYGHENYKASADEEMIMFHKLSIKELQLVPMTEKDYKLLGA
jgi:hypothetical protein